MNDTEKVYIGLLLFLVLVAGRYIVCEISPHILINGYLVMGVIGFGLTYTYTKQYDLSLFTALILIFGITVYRYVTDPEDLSVDKYNSFKNTSLFIIGLGICAAIITYKKVILPYTKLANFVFIIYMLSSFLEWTVHKYILHCTTNKTINSIIDKIPYFKETCKSHIDHHVNVNVDMTVNDKEEDHTNDAKFRMGWNIFIPLLLGFLLFGFIAKYISGYNISIIPLLIISFITTFAWEYIWNKTHAAMHDFEYEYSVTKGPYDNGILNTEYIKKVLYTNHEAHHLQKGDRKGNYNIIFFGADEWLLTNNKTIDNTEYCKTHSKEQICRKQPTR